MRICELAGELVLGYPSVERRVLDEIEKQGALFLACDDSCYMTAETLVLDGRYVSNGKLAGVTYPDD